MARAGITYTDVSTAVQTLQAKGKNITVENVRNVLGTGSASTINRLLNEYRAEKRLLPETSSLPTVLASAVTKLWAELQIQAEQELQALREQGRVERENSESKLTIASKALAEKAKENHQLTEEKDYAFHQLKELQASLTEAEQGIGKQMVEIQHLKERIQEQQSANDRLHHLHQNVQKNLEHYQTKTQELQHQQATVLENQRVQFAQEQHQLTQQLTQAVQRVQKLEIKLEQNQVQLNESRERRRTALAEKAQLESRQAKLEIQQEELLSQNQQLKEEKAELAQTLEVKTQLVLRGEFLNQAKEAELIKAQEQIKAQDTKIELLRSKKWQLAQEKAQLQGNLVQLEKMFQYPSA